MKRWTSYFLVLLVLCTLCSCAPTKEVVVQGVPEGYVVVKKATLQQVLDEMIYIKLQLLECLERERAREAGP
jgi:hypothetical protein